MSMGTIFLILRKNYPMNKQRYRLESKRSPADGGVTGKTVSFICRFQWHQMIIQCKYKARFGGVMAIHALP